jgi:hypothetical protein
MMEFAYLVEQRCHRPSSPSPRQRQQAVTMTTMMHLLVTIFAHPLESQVPLDGVCSLLRKFHVLLHSGRIDAYARVFPLQSWER